MTEGEFDVLETMIGDNENNINTILETLENLLQSCSENLKRQKRIRHPAHNKKGSIMNVN